MKIYVITAGEYSDYHIVAVTTDKEKADNFVKVHNDSKRFYYDDAYVEEYDTDDFDIAINDRNGKYFRVFGDWDYAQNCVEIECDEIDSLDYITKRNSQYYTLMIGDACRWEFYCTAKDEEHAIKKATDWAGQKKAEIKGVI